jgi:hypothetical protein
MFSLDCKPFYQFLGRSPPPSPLMSLKEKIVAPFRDFTGTLKDVAWWVGGAIGVYVLVRPHWNSLWMNVTVHSIASVFLSYAVIRAAVYRKRNIRIFTASKHAHSLIHNLRNRLSQELTYVDNSIGYAEVTEKDVRDASIQSLSESLQEIIDSASLFFSDLTGCPCTAVLLMPEHTPTDGNHLKARLYSLNASGERKKAAKPHKTGLILQAFKGSDVIVCPELADEMKKGNFDKRGESEPFKYYKSCILCHFKVRNEAWGVLSIDSPRIKAFRPPHRDLLCLFADACALAFVLSEHGDFGNHVYQPAKN